MTCREELLINDDLNCVEGSLDCGRCGIWCPCSRFPFFQLPGPANHPEIVSLFPACLRSPRESDEGEQEDQMKELCSLSFALGWCGTQAPPGVGPGSLQDHLVSSFTEH